MIQERTKFRNAFDRKQYMDDMFHEFLEVYTGKLPDKSIKPINVEFIRLINEYNEKYVYFQRVTTIVVAFIKKFNDMDGIVHKLIILKGSAKKQNVMLNICKKILKKNKFEKKYEEPIRVTIQGINKRIDYLLKLVDTAYIEMTPLDNYKKMLEEKGEDFFDEIINEFPLTEKIGPEEENQMVQNYIEKVLSSFSDNGDWEEGYKKYNTFLQKKFELIEKGREADKLKARKNRQEMAEKKLIQISTDIQRRYDDAMITTGYHIGIDHLHKEVLKSKEQGRMRNKIILLAKTMKGYEATPHYYSKTAKEPFGNSLSSCSILGEFEELPKDILDKIENGDVAMVEVMLH